MHRITLYTLGGGLLIVLLLNLILSKPHFASAEEEAEHLSQKGKLSEALALYKDLAIKNPLRVDLQYKYVRHYFSASESDSNDAEILTYYTHLSHDTNPSMADIGLYGTGLYYSYVDNYDKAIRCYREVKNKALPYLNNSLGWCLMQQKKDTEAEKHFYQEIHVHGNSSSAYKNLAELYRDNHDDRKLDQLLQDKEAWSAISFETKRTFFFHQKSFLRYFLAVFESIFSASNRYGFIAAFCILMVWLLYLRRLDIYETEKWSMIIITLLLGIICAHLTFLLNDINQLMLGNKLTGSFLNDFIYCFLGIGAVEELVKILPLIFILAFSKEINEPIDYIKYASISAVGFAFTENLLYFQNDALHIIPSRALICVTGHMFYSSVIAYGIMLSKYRNHKHPWATIIASFSIAAFLHGFYDFWLIHETIHLFSKISLLMFLVSTVAWIILVNNCLSNSPFYDKEKAIDTVKFRDYLFASLLGIFFLMFILIAFQEGPEEGNKALLKETMIGLLVLPLVARNMSNIHIMRHYWNYHSYPKPDIIYHDIIHQRITIVSTEKDTLQTIPRMIMGKVSQREVISNEPNWFEVELDEPLISGERHYFRLYFSPYNVRKSYRSSFVAYVLLPNTHDLHQPKEKEQLLFAGQIEVKIL